MKFWNGMYGNKIYHLNYEKLTEHQTEETMSLMNYLDISWDERLLSHHKNPRIINTASNIQVREKIYKNSSESWIKFRPYLNGIFNEIKSFNPP